MGAGYNAKGIRGISHSNVEMVRKFIGPLWTEMNPEKRLVRTKEVIPYFVSDSRKEISKLCSKPPVVRVQASKTERACLKGYTSTRTSASRLFAEGEDEYG